MDSRLTDEMIAEILTRHGELLQAYQNQIRELTEDYNTENELIEITQLRSPRYGVVGKSSNQVSLDQVYQAVEKQRKEYQEAVCAEIQRLLEAQNQVQQIYLCYLHLPKKQKEILKELYINKKLYKELEHPGLSERTIHRIRKQGLETIKKLYLSKEFAGTEIQ